MTRIAVRRGMLIVALLCCAACRTPPAGGTTARQVVGPARTFTFDIDFDKGCPTKAKPDVANCDEAPSKPSDPDCVYVSTSRKDRVKFKPVDAAAATKFTVRFPAECGLSATPDASQADDKHWDLQIASGAPLYKECKFTVYVSDACKLDPTVIIGP